MWVFVKVLFSAMSAAVTQDSFVNARGARLATYHVTTPTPASPPKAILVVAHGYANYGG